MSILDNLNQRLTIDDGEICVGGENEIEKIINIAPIILPDDYIEFLKNVSGVGNWGIVFSVDETGNMIYMGCKNGTTKV